MLDDLKMIGTGVVAKIPPGISGKCGNKRSKRSQRKTRKMQYS